MTLTQNKRQERDKQLLQAAEHMIAIEHAYGVEAHGPYYNSTHEGWAVIREEVLETQQQCRAMHNCITLMDAAVRDDNAGNTYDSLYAMTRVLQDSAMNAAIEAVHTAAAARTMLLTLNAMRECDE